MSNQSKPILIAIVAALATLVIGLLIGNWYGNKTGYDKGYAVAQEEAAKLQKEASRKAVEETAKAANPFQVTNPLEGVEADPFEKTRKILNPFE